jgi:hypothetical protein
MRVSSRFYAFAAWFWSVHHVALGRIRFVHLNDVILHAGVLVAVRSVRRVLLTYRHY